MADILSAEEINALLEELAQEEINALLEVLDDVEEASKSYKLNSLREVLGECKTISNNHQNQITIPTGVYYTMVGKLTEYKRLLKDMHARLIVNRAERARGDCDDC